MSLVDGIARMRANDCALDEAGLAEWREWQDRKPPCAFLATMQCPDGRTVVLAEHVPTTWRDFLVDGELIEQVRRTGPDRVPPVQPCGCEVCANGRQNADVGPGRTNGGKVEP